MDYSAEKPVSPTTERLQIELHRLEWAKELNEDTLTAITNAAEWIKVVRVGGYTRITTDSIRAFHGEYISLAELANREETSSRALMDCCRRNSIQLLMLRLCHQLRHAFITRCYSKQLMQCFRERNNYRTPPELETDIALTEPQPRHRKPPT
jgi:hypothetical protein